jgi:large subunit ribosomal protein L22
MQPVVDLIRGKHVRDALHILRSTQRRAASIIDKVLRSAIANADQSLEADMDNLMVKEAWVNEGPTRKKWMPRARGRVGTIRNRTSHVSVVLDDGQ